MTEVSWALGNPRAHVWQAQSLAHLLQTAPSADTSRPTGIMFSNFSEHPSRSGIPGRVIWTRYCLPPRMWTADPTFMETQYIGSAASSMKSPGSSSSAASSSSSSSARLSPLGRILFCFVCFPLCGLGNRWGIRRFLWPSLHIPAFRHRCGPSQAPLIPYLKNSCRAHLSLLTLPALSPPRPFAGH